MVDVLSDMAKSRLYSYTEAERRKFDFACELQRDWSRPTSMPTQATLKGRVFLDLCAQLWRQHQTGTLNAEMTHILRLLDLRYDPEAIEESARTLHLAGPLLTEVPKMAAGRLIATIAAAVARWGIDFETIEHVVPQHSVKLPAWWPDNPAE
ncbi:hypothetical protein FG87_25270 [Nocardia vulneris]|uniref:Uncharacterized protein n=1 Tax=Nocardia vulneris TaxID=1141657 RepID=A0ABR4ZAV9_9NOCA|nr:hypothetical protein FG87_25270 [Nocardia vulneris]